MAIGLDNDRQPMRSIASAVFVSGASEYAIGEIDEEANGHPNGEPDPGHHG